MMKKTLRACAAAAALALFLAGCASQGPAVSGPPEVSVSWFNSTVIRPELVKFEAKIVIENRMSAPLDFQRVDYAVDLLDTELFTDSFDGLKRTNGYRNQTVTFPFQIVMKDIVDQSVGILAEGGMRVTFRGTVYPAASSGFARSPTRSPNFSGKGAPASWLTLPDTPTISGRLRSSRHSEARW